MNNENKSVIVIGASGGIGNKTAELLLEIGYKVIGTFYKDKPSVENLLDKDNFKSIEVDVRSIQSINNLKNNIESEIYAIVNCSGIVDFEGENLDKDFEIWDKTIATNLSGNYYLAKIFFNKLIEKGRFIMISSTDSYYGGAVTTAYAASKMGVNSLTKSLSLLFKDKKILVNSVAPGWVLTKMTEGEGEEFLGKVAEMNPLSRIGKPEDIAKVIKFLLSDDSSYINGQVISVEGGYTNQDPTLLLEEDVVS